jgi:cleavage and polyadenylation specificity factor subunit 5
MGSRSRRRDRRAAKLIARADINLTASALMTLAESVSSRTSTQRLHQLSFQLTNKMSTITTTALQTSYPPVLPKSFNGNQPKTIRLYPLSNYTFGTKETQPEEDPSVLARLKRLEEHYVAHGMRRTCEGILVCHEHNHPHILMLQIANAFFKLPGDYLKPDDDEIEGFKARLNERLAPVGTQFTGEGVNEDWEIADTLAQWWRPNFETFMYPFIPAHVTRPKECKKLYFIQLPRQSKSFKYTIFKLR